MKTEKDRNEENRMFEFMVDCKLAKAGLKSLFDPNVELNDECIKVLESIPNWSWDFKPDEVKGIVDAIL